MLLFAVADFNLKNKKVPDIAIMMTEKLITCNFPVYQRRNFAAIFLEYQQNKRLYFYSIAVEITAAIFPVKRH